MLNDGWGQRGGNERSKKPRLQFSDRGGEGHATHHGATLPRMLVAVYNVFVTLLIATNTLQYNNAPVYSLYIIH